MIRFCFRDSNVEEKVLAKRDETLRNVESRMNLGLERQINVIVSYVRFLLNTEQKKSDFKPEDENRAISAHSNVCQGIRRNKIQVF
jgi:recyclin-1